MISFLSFVKFTEILANKTCFFPSILDSNFGLSILIQLNSSSGTILQIRIKGPLMFSIRAVKSIILPTSSTFSNFIFIKEGKPALYSMFERQGVRQIVEGIPKTRLGSTTYCFSRPVYDEILENNFIGTSTVVVRKADIIEAGFFDESLVGIEDRDMWLRLSKIGKIFAFDTEVLGCYRLLEGSLSRQTRNIVSRLDFYHRLLKCELSNKNKKIVRNRLGEIYLQYALVLRNQKKFLAAIKQNMKSLFYIRCSDKQKSAIGLIKIIILMFFPNLSDAFAKNRLQKI